MIKELVKKSPYCIQKGAKTIWSLIPYNIIMGKRFKQTYQFLEKSQWWTEQQHEEYQIRELKRLLEHAYNNVPYYTRIFDERGLKPKDIKKLHDLKKLPYLTKEIIHNYGDELIAKNYNKKDLCYVTTGGTTGLPMGFYRDCSIEDKLEWAYICNLWNTIGYKICKKNKVVILRGEIPVKGYFERSGNKLILSSYDITNAKMMDYIRKIQEFNPDFIQAYPSSISTLANFILKNNIKIDVKKLKAVICASENLYDFQRKEIEKAFRTRVYSFYGHTEHACLAGECEKSTYYHLKSEYGYTELINFKGQDLCEEDEVGEIVCTGFNNYVMPFIRYRTGDLAVNTNKKCSCGRSYKLIKKVQGRMQEFFVDKTGALITFTCSDDALWSVKDKILAYQYIQNEPGRVILNIECDIKLTDSDLKCIRDEFMKFYSRFCIEIKIVEHIERTRKGKFRFLIQNIEIDDSNGNQFSHNRLED